MPMAKAKQLRQKTKAEMLKQLDDYKAELASLRVEQVTGNSASKLGKIKSVRKSVAVVKTVLHEATRAAVRKHYAGAKYKPLDLRRKLTRAMRRRLTKREANAKTARQIKRERAFPKLVYAVKA
ncbi:60S ribosomal protein L35 [Salpingoeca rosetta]|uniref:60S ribosomal protein L35 n=1 Tax=Salpingoeca rosetta (strain ATCC 50818 / BSB-021) TaxID=946362 RepID=F2U630_SALR5|nr:60S ribosomal protein L35 [Salpingoeca rosetta]EGD82971.1 60S ribosomal protein L35 [Salpingoeca rosetta]|eukprot:XP_004995335.1 60S ribosomal protein L35 [Salpingoeca rosetta]